MARYMGGCQSGPPLGPLNIRCRINNTALSIQENSKYTKDPESDHCLDIHPYPESVSCKSILRGPGHFLPT